MLDDLLKEYIDNFFRAGDVCVKNLKDKQRANNENKKIKLHCK